MMRLRGRVDVALRAMLDAQGGRVSPLSRRWLTPRELGRSFGAAPRQLKRVEAWLRAEGCRIRRPAGLQQVQCVGGRPRAIPAAVASTVEDVLDLDAPLDILHHLAGGRLRTLAPNGDFFFTPQEYAGFYDFAGLQASGFIGTGERIGIIGTAPVDPANIAAFRTRFGLPALELEQHGTATTSRLDDADF